MSIASINGVSLHYHVKGNGIPILFIHPPLLNSANFNYQLAQLTGQFRVITFDIRGHGHTSPSKEPLTYPLIVEDMKQLLDHLNIKQAFVCGYSTGGSIALEALLTYPQRFLGGIIISGMSELSGFGLRCEVVLATLFSSNKLLFGILSRAIAKSNSDMMLTYRNLHKNAKIGNIRNIRQFYQCSLNYQCTDRLNQIKHPILLIYGEKDKQFKKYAKILELQLPVCELRFIPGVNHQIPTKAANAMNELIRRWVQDRTTVKQESDEGEKERLSPNILAGITAFGEAQREDNI